MISRISMLMLVLFCGVSVFAAQPARFNYQAKLTGPDGLPLEGTHTVFFRIYQGGDASTADSGTLVYEENAALAVAGGVANHTVGTGDGQSPGQFTTSMIRTNQDVFLQVSVDVIGSVVLPRTRLESVPFSLLSADGDSRIALGQPGSFPLTLSEPGSYYFTQNITLPTPTDTGIHITTAGVTLDLNGFALIGNDPITPSGIWVDTAAADVEIRNGTITEMRLGILASASMGTHVHHIRANHNGARGLNLGANCLVEDCIIENTGGAAVDVEGIMVGNNSIVRRCICSTTVAQSDGINGFGILAANGCLIADCTCNGNTGQGGNAKGVGIAAASGCKILDNVCNDNLCTGTGVGTGIGISASADCEVSGNVCRNNTSSQVNGIAIGIISSNGDYVHDNTCTGNNGFGTGGSTGIQGSASARIENNHCTNHTGSTSRNYGIRVFGSGGAGTTVIKNTTTLNATAGLRFENSSGANYYAENVFDETTSVSEAAGGLNVAGTGDRSNVSF